MGMLCCSEDISQQTQTKLMARYTAHNRSFFPARFLMINQIINC